MNNRPLDDASLIGCPHGDKDLWRHREDSLNRTQTLSLGAGVIYVIANTVPLLGPSAVGDTASTTVFERANPLAAHE